MGGILPLCHEPKSFPMYRCSLTLSLIFLCLSCVLTAQKVWTLEECILYAQQNSLISKQAQYNTRLAELQLKQDRFQRLPNLNANTNLNWQFGRTVDPTTNLFVSQDVFSNSVGLNTNIPIFTGLQINRSVKQSRLNLEAAELEGEASLNDLALQVAAAYLNILLSEEQVENATRQLELSQNQLDQTLKQIASGALADNERYEFEAQLARSEQTLVVAQNTVEQNYLTLKQFLELDPTTQMEIVAPEVETPDADPYAFGVNEVYQTALTTQPDIRANDLRYEASALGEKIARGSMWPSLSFFGQLNSFYSDQGRNLTDPIITDLPPEAVTSPVLINGVDANLTQFVPQQEVTFPNRDYLGQIGDNFGQSFGLGLQVPIYNRHVNNIAAERARITALNQQVTNRQRRQQLKTDVDRAVQNARASLESFQAAERSLESARIAYENAEKRFELGSINSYEFTNARNNFDQAQISYTQSRYQYIFDLKTVDFYLGRPLSLD